MSLLVFEPFGERMISISGPMKWACELTPMCYFMLGYVNVKLPMNANKSDAELTGNLSQRYF